MTPQEHIDEAERQVGKRGREDGADLHALAHAAIAIAQLLQANIVETYFDGLKVGAEATASAVGSILPLLGGPSFNVNSDDNGGGQ